MNQQHPLDPSAHRQFDRGQGIGENQHMGQQHSNGGGGVGGGDNTER